MGYDVLVTVNGEGSTILTFPGTFHKAVCLRELSGLCTAYQQDIIGIGGNRPLIKKLIKDAEHNEHCIAYKAYINEGAIPNN